MVIGGNSVSNHDDLSQPSHPPKEKYSFQPDSGEACSNPFECYALSNGNEKLNDDFNKKYKVYTDIDSDGKTEIITDITKPKYLPWKLKLTLVLRQTVYHWVISGTCFPNSARKMACPRRQPWNQLWHSLRHIMVELCKPMDGSLCQLKTSVTTSFILWGTWWKGKMLRSW